ncbi:glycosyltransferase family 2 protein [Acidianus sp. RZ1]|uniref:glycosyltransferase family 2 protein n=1 Tax=Acidianus sp. RZ1 TaxID=1540082 RepID=UPI0014928142|nr:glycosyltransferase [Acidianus sp. RZ1]NON63046.1 glycosyltransferase [Acidianus sp. RZ1]
MLVSIIIPTSNASDTIFEVLDSIRKQDYKEIEIIVVDNGSIDSTGEIVKKMKEEMNLPLRYMYFKDKLGHAGAINKGIEESKGDVILILHDDMVLGEENWISSMLKAIENDNVGIGSSLLVTPPEKLSKVNRVFSYIYILGWHRKIHGDIYKVPFSGLNNDMIKRKVIEKVGLPSNSYKFGMHDLDFSERVRRSGYDIILNPMVHVEHLLSFYQRSLKSHLKKAWQYGFPSFIILKRYKYLPNLDNLLFFLNFILFSLSFFLNFNFLFAISILFSVLTFPFEQPNFYGKKRYVLRSKKLIISYLIGLALFIISRNLFFLGVGGSLVAYRSISNSITSYRELKDPTISLAVLFLYPVWALINGFSLLVGIFKFL